MGGGSERVSATFWLVEAPDSLARQSRREPDGTGIGAYDADEQPWVDRQPIAAYEDQQFAREAREIESRTFVAHVRYASNGGLTLQNTHPFEMNDRLFAHNGVIADLPTLERELGSDGMSVVHGETDSERYFALITRAIDRCEGDVRAGIVAATNWIADHLPVLSVNFVLITATDLWALRYPDTHELYVLQRAAGGPSGGRHLEHASARGSIRVRAAALANRAAVVVATERMDEDVGWRLLESGELLHVDGDLNVSSTRPLEDPPAHLLTLADLDQRAAASQTP
jgi:glutamine amidotransferase